VIENAIDAARCVIVIWTENSVESDWVHNEADEGKRRNILVPVRMGDVKIPLGFRHLQAADLSEWKPGATHAEYDGLLESIRGVFGQPAPIVDAKPHRPPPRVERHEKIEPVVNDDKRRSRKVEWIAAGVAVAVIAGAIISAFEEDSGYEQSPPIDVGNLGGATADEGLADIVDDAKGADSKGAANATHWTVQWQDHAVRFDGKLAYTGGQQAQIQATLHDLSTGSALGNQTFPVQLQSSAAGQYAISGEVVIPNGDSTTPGRHTHTVFIQLQQQANGAVMAQNCTMQGCYPASVALDGGGD
jgi:hypothetical protein